MMKSRKAISPVIATVILVAVAITIAVAVSYWMSGISSQYTRFEKVEIGTATSTLDANGNWIVTLALKNTGTTTATISNVYINNEEVSDYDAVAPVAAVATLTSDLTTAITSGQLTSGDTGTFHVYVGATYGTLSSGTTVNIKVHSAGGMDYIKLVELV